MTDVRDSTTHLAPAGDSMSAFYAEVNFFVYKHSSEPMLIDSLQISAIQGSIKNFNDNVSRIGDLHSRSLNNTDENAAQRNHAQLEELVGDTSALSATLKRRIKALERQGGSGRDAQIRKQQVSLLALKVRVVEPVFS